MSDMVELEGVVTEVLPATMFRVKLQNGSMVLAHLSGRMRKHFIKIMTGDRVSLEISPYDLTKARITYRHQPENSGYSRTVTHSAPNRGGRR